MSPTLESMMFAFAGGCMYSIMLLYKDINIARKNRNKKTFLFWLFFALWPFVGAILVLAQTRSGSTITAWPSMVTGFMAASTFQTMMNTSMKKNKSKDKYDKPIK